MRGSPARAVRGALACVAVVTAALAGRFAGPAAAEGLAGFDFDPFWLWSEVAAGDLDGDGFDDLCAVQSYVDGPPPHRARIVPFHQDPSQPGRFRRRRSIGVGSDAWRLRLADVDGDGRLDAVTSAAGSVTVVLLQGDGEPDVRTYRLNGFVDAVATGDVDGDGRTDVVACAGRGTFALLQDPSRPGVLLPAERIGAASMAAAVGEFADGALPDVALASWDRRFVVQTDRTADGPASVVPLPTRRGHQALALADLDGDDRVELIHAGGGWSGPRRVEVYTDAPDGDVAPVVSRTPAAVTWMAVADFDRDGRPDLAFGNRTRVAWMRQRADAPGTFDRAASRGIGRFQGFGAVGDLNADGLPDFAVVGAAVRVVLQDPDAPGTLLRARRLPRAE